MSKIQDRINEINKISKRNRIITSLLAIVIIAFVILTGLNRKQITELNKSITTKNDSLVDLRVQDSLKTIELTNKNEELLYVQNQLSEKEAEYKRQLDSIAAANAGGGLWTFAKKANTFEAYYAYIDEAGAENLSEDRVNEIKDAIESIMTRKGWVQIKESNGSSLFNQIDNPLDENTVILTAKSARSVRHGAIGRSGANSSRNGDVISKDQHVIVVDTYKFSSGAEWAEIAYSNKS